MTVKTSEFQDIATRKRKGWRGMSGLAKKEARDGYLFLLPNLLGFLVFNVFPMAAALVLTFCHYDLRWPPTFVGLDNFVRMKDDWLFWKTFGNTLYWVAGSVVPTVIIALTLALLINRPMRGVLGFRLIYFIPNITLMVAASVIWLWIYHPDFGLFNYILHLVGIKGPAWLHSSEWAMPALMLMGWWKGSGYSMLIFLAGLQGVPAELYEAAIVDGATGWQRFWRITLPLLSPATFFVLTTSFIGAFQGFDQFYIMTRGGPAHATTTMVLHIYNNGFNFFRMGYSCSMAMVLFACILLITLFQWRAASSWVFGFAD